MQDFWRVVGDRVKKFRPAEEVPLGKTRIIVLEAEDGKFSVKAGRRIINCSIETIPVWLVNALIEGMPANDRPSKKAYAAFLALDPEGDRARAKELWSGLASTDNTVESLLALLDSLPLAAEAVRAYPKTVTAGCSASESGGLPQVFGSVPRSIRHFCAWQNDGNWSRGLPSYRMSRQEGTGPGCAASRRVSSRRRTSRHRPKNGFIRQKRPRALRISAWSCAHVRFRRMNVSLRPASQSGAGETLASRGVVNYSAVYSTSFSWKYSSVSRPSSWR